MKGRGGCQGLVVELAHHFQGLSMAVETEKKLFYTLMLIVSLNVKQTNYL